MNIHLEYSLTEDDYHELNRAFHKMNKSRRDWSWAMVGWTVILAFAITIFVMFHGSSAAKHGPAPVAPVAPSNKTETILNIAPWILFFCLAAFFYVRARFSKSGIRQAIKENPSLTERLLVSLTDESMVVRTESSNTDMKWNHFQFFHETSNAFLLFNTKQTAHILPKRAFCTKGELDEFRGFAQAHVGNEPIGFPVQPAKGGETGTLPGDVEQGKERP